MQATRDGFAVAYGARSSSGASSVYPMPRTVWMSFGLNASSIFARRRRMADRKSTRLNSSHLVISYAVFCLKKKKKHKRQLCQYIPHKKYSHSSSKTNMTPYLHIVLSS